MDCLTDLGLRSSSESEGVLPDDLWVPGYESMIHVGWIDFSGVGMKVSLGRRGLDIETLVLPCHFGLMIF